LPRGTRKTAEERRKAMETQLIPTAPKENSALIDGRAIFMDAPRKGLMKEVMTIDIRINLFVAGLRSIIQLFQTS
jgi:hypothetical protein